MQKFKVYLVSSLFIIALLTSSDLFAGYYTKVNIKVIVSRSDNGLRIPGAIVLFGYPFDGESYADENGIINVTKEMHSYSDEIDITILDCSAQGYYPAPKQSFSNGEAVLVRKIYKSNPIATISIVLRPIRQYTPSLQAPHLLSPLNGEHLMAELSIRFRWDPLPNAYSYQIMYSRNDEFAKDYTNYKTITALTNLSEVGIRISRNILIRLLRGSDNTIYWKVRASDGKHWGDWSEVRFFIIGYNYN